MKEKLLILKTMLFKHPRWIVALMLMTLCGTGLKAENLKQSFTSDFASTSQSSTENPVDEDNWCYVNLMRETNATNIFDGEAAIRLYTPGYATSGFGQITTPEKTGGVGLVSFWYKNLSASTPKIAIQTSEDGLTFTTFEEVTVVASAPYTNYSRIINRPNAKYVRLELGSVTATYQSSNVYFDEIIITDAPGANITSPTTADDIIGIVGETTFHSYQVFGTNITAPVTVRIKEPGNGFAITDGEITIPASDVNDGYLIPIAYTAETNALTTAKLEFIGADFPDMIRTISGSALPKIIGEGFNTYISNSFTNTTWNGWVLENGGTTSSPAHTLYEGGYSVKFYGSLTSPAKAAGVGTISFMHRTAVRGEDVDVTIAVSSDGTNWDNVGSFVSTDTIFEKYTTEINNATAKFVKLSIPTNIQQKTLILDQYIITADGNKIAEVTPTEPKYIFNTLPLNDVIPLTFANISEDVKLTITNSENIQIGKTTLTPSEATGTYDLPVTFNPSDPTVNFMAGILTISKGGIAFPVNIPVLFYRERESLFDGFESSMQVAPGGSTFNGPFYSTEGFYVYRATHTTSASVQLPGSRGCLSLNKDATIITPEMKSGVGSVEFYLRNMSSTSFTNVYISVSEDAVNWTLKHEIDSTNFTNVYKSFDFVINDQTAKFVKFEFKNGLTSYMGYLDNITITEYGVGIPKIVFKNNPEFEANGGEEQILNFQINGLNLTSDVTINFANGEAFSSEITTIPLADINEKTYTLPVKFNPGKKTHYTDTLSIVSDDFNITPEIQLGGYGLQNFVFEDFNTTGAFSRFDDNTSNYFFDGWKIYTGSRSTMAFSSPSAVLLNISMSSSFSNARLLSPKKIGGVGVIQYYVRGYSYSDQTTLIVNTYKTLEGTPTEVDNVTIPPTSVSSAYVMYEIEVNDPDAQYVEFLLNRPSSGTAQAIIDDVVITENGKKVPNATAPAKLDINGYVGEPTTLDFEISVSEVYDDLTISMANESESFSITPEEIITEDGVATVTATLTFTATEDKFIQTNNIVISSPGLVRDIIIPVTAQKRDETISQDFNTSWGSTYSYGNLTLDGWVITRGRRNNNANFTKEGTTGSSSLQLYYGRDEDGTLTSPIKAGGIKDITFSYFMNAPLDIVIETSEDGTEWTEVYFVDGADAKHDVMEDVTVPVNDAKANFMRIISRHNFTTGDGQFYIDNITITGMPYLRQVGTIQPMVVNTVPQTIPVTIAGVLEENASIAMSGGENSNFTLSVTTVTPNDLIETITDPEPAEKQKSFSFDVTFSADDSGEYNENIILTNSEGIEYLVIPVSVTYNAPEIKLVGQAPEIETSILPETFDITIEGLILDNVPVTIEGDDSGLFAVVPATITPQDLENEEGFALTVTFDGATQSGTYQADVVFGNYLTVPVQVTYNKVYIDLVGQAPVIEASILPETFEVTIQGMILENVNINITGEDADNFSITSAVITPQDLEQGNFELEVTFDNATENRTYQAEIVFGDYLNIPVTVNYEKAYLELVEEIGKLVTYSPTDIIAVAVEGNLSNDARITITGENAAVFTLEKTTITPQEISEGTVNFNITFTAPDTDRLSEYTAELVIRDDNGYQYLTATLEVTYDPNGIENETAGNMTVYIDQDGYLKVTGADAGELVTLYNLDGQALLNAKVESADESYPTDVKQGVYVVKVGKYAYKVVRR